MLIFEEQGEQGYFDYLAIRRKSEACNFCRSLAGQQFELEKRFKLEKACEQFEAGLIKRSPPVTHRTRFQQDGSQPR